MRPTPGLMALRRWVATHGVRQRRISEATGMSPALVCRILKGQLPISKPAAIKLAGFTGLPVEILVNQRFVLIVRNSDGVV